MPEAVICRFCHSDLKKNLPADKRTDKQPPGFWQAALFNLICPGMGAWRCGYRQRGAITMLILVGALLIAAVQIGDVLNKKVALAMRTGRTQVVYQISDEIKDNVWLDIFFYGYIISFIDLWFLAKKQQDAIKKIKTDDTGQKQ
jgi:hypothetical protein